MWFLDTIQYMLCHICVRIICFFDRIHSKHIHRDAGAYDVHADRTNSVYSSICAIINATQWQQQTNTTNIQLTNWADEPKSMWAAQFARARSRMIKYHWTCAVHLCVIHIFELANSSLFFVCASSVFINTYWILFLYVSVYALCVCVLLLFLFALSTPYTVFFFYVIIFHRYYVNI